MRPALFALALPLSLAVVGAEASAHARLVRSTPAANATVASPKVITLTFSERLTPAFSRFDLGTRDGRKIKVRTAASKDRKSLIGAPQRRLTPGAYTITWHAASADDGHRMDGTVPFTVR